MSKNKTIEYRVWNIMNIDNEGFGKLTVYIPVDGPENAVHLINSIAKFQLQLPESIVGSNVFGLECRTLVNGDGDGEWLEWENDEFGNVDELAEFMGVEFGY